MRERPRVVVTSRVLRRLVAEAREVAERRDTTLSALVERALRELVARERVETQRAA